MQALEDALCLVFLETQFQDLAARLDTGRMIDVLRKTLRKMSDGGKRLARTIDLSSPERALLEQVLAG